MEAIAQLVYFGSIKYQIAQTASRAVVKNNMILHNNTFIDHSLTQGLSLGFELDQLKTDLFHFCPNIGKFCVFGCSFVDETALELVLQLMNPALYL